MVIGSGNRFQMNDAFGRGGDAGTWMNTFRRWGAGDQGDGVRVLQDDDMGRWAIKRDEGGPDCNID